MKKTLLISLSLAAAALSQAYVISYDNIDAPSAVSAGTSSLDLQTIWGDQVNLATAGKLDYFRMSLFNSSSSGNTASILTATVNVKFYDISGGAYTSGSLASQKPLLGQFNGNINFGTGLPPGYFSIITWTGLSSLNINLTSAVMVTQQVLSSTGGSIRMGVVTYTADNVGSSAGGDSWYRNNSSGEGLFTFGTAASNKMAYTIGTVPEPATLAVLGLGALALLRRRRN